MSTDKSEELEVGERTWKRATEPIQSDGFREGYDAGRTDNLQIGFDMGYEMGFNAAFSMGYHNGVLRVAEHVAALSEILKRSGIKPQEYDSASKGNCQICPKTGTLSKKDTIEALINAGSIEEIRAKHKILVDGSQFVNWIKSQI